MQEHYYAASPYNLVRIILGQRETADHDRQNVYTRAAGWFQDWRRQGIFLQDPQPSIYSYSQTFTTPGSSGQVERTGFIAVGRLEDYSAGVVFRHEQTLAQPKADRLNLLRATRAHFGQLFMLYSGSGEIESLLTASTSPDLEVEDEYQVRHRVWRISDPAVIDLVRGQMRDQRLIIADGHHRYETALAYRDERRAAETASPSEAAPYERVMMTFVNMNSPGLVILPTHRVVHSLAHLAADAFHAATLAHFRVEEVDPACDAARAAGLLREAGRMGTALLAVTATRNFLLHSPKSTGSQLFSGFSLRQQSLDVVQLHQCMLENVLGLSEESIRNQHNLSYLRDAGEAMARVRAGGANVAFLMNPVRIEQVRDLAFAGEVLPQKSTDFYPKLLSGLTIYALD
jgi:uncharacterized protein (DUF1015 family)